MIEVFKFAVVLAGIVMIAVIVGTAFSDDDDRRAPTVVYVNGNTFVSYGVQYSNAGITFVTTTGYRIHSNNYATIRAHCETDACINQARRLLLFGEEN